MRRRQIELAQVRPRGDADLVRETIPGPGAHPRSEEEIKAHLVDMQRTVLEEANRVGNN